MAYICTKPKGSCKTCSHFRLDEDYGYGAYSCFAQTDKKDISDIIPGMDAVFLPGTIHGCEDEIYIVYLNEAANEGRGSFEIEILDAERILKLNEEVNGDAEAFFESLPDLFQGEWKYCDNTPDTKEAFDEYVNAYFKADFILGRDGGKPEELMFLTAWAYEVIMRRAIK